MYLFPYPQVSALVAMAEGRGLSQSSSQERTDLVAYWSVPLLDGVHTIEFEHGTTSGKRVVRVDGKEIIRREWMFKLVGEEIFNVGKQHAKCVLRVDPMPHFTFSYSLYVDGKPLEKFTEKQSQSIRSWAVLSEGKRYRVVFEKQSLDIHVNGQVIEAENSFVDDGTEMKFELGSSKAIIKANCCDKKQGVIHQLFVNSALIEEDTFS
ncbi:fas apoptotic inhibitory molecule 1 [Anoplophora glabripennis]|uniref:fas apoptotic inhibitory molecule 1 n=1 Tax=Anoplophora glabripennis TaxID=217634 RepID=UPI00087431EA|nr:fas apoptotic inhibitory molecule 1 [Anoplophora glabripennis]